MPVVIAAVGLLVAVGAIATAFLELDDLPTREQRDALRGALRDTYSLDIKGAEEVTILGHWFVSECGGPNRPSPDWRANCTSWMGQTAFSRCWVS